MDAQGNERKDRTPILKSIQYKYLYAGCAPNSRVLASHLWLTVCPWETIASLGRWIHRGLPPKAAIPFCGFVDCHLTEHIASFLLLTPNLMLQKAKPFFGCCSESGPLVRPILFSTRQSFSRISIFCLFHHFGVIPLTVNGFSRADNLKWPSFFHVPKGVLFADLNSHVQS